jgi:hypothetical protein
MKNSWHINEILFRTGAVHIAEAAKNTAIT